MGVASDNFKLGRVKAAAFIVAAAFVVYGSTLWNGFVYDDNYQVLGNPWILDAGNITAIFTSSNWEFRSGGSNIYRPLFQLLLLIEYHLFGFNPAGFHLVNILLHALNGALVYAVALRVFATFASGASGGIWPFVAALVFLLHPVNSEPVAWVSALPELTYTALVLVSFLLYASGAGNVKYWLSVAVFFAALFTKETSVALVLFIVAFDFASKGRAFLAGWLRYVPYAAVIVVYAFVRFYAVGGFLYRKHVAISLYEAVLHAFPLMCQYFLKLVLPIGLSVIYVFYPATSLFEPKVVVSILALAIMVAVIILSRRNGAVFFAAAWVFVPLLPVIYVPALAASPFAERYLYLPSAGFAMLVSFCLWRLSARFDGRRILPVVVAALVVFAVSSGLRARTWQSDFTLWSDAVLKAPDSTHAHYNLAWIHHGAGEYDEAIFHYRESLRLNPRGADAHYNVGLIYLETRRFDDAAEEFRAAVSIDPGYADARRRLDMVMSLNPGEGG